MTTNTLAARPTLRFFPLIRSEFSRLTHRRLLRVLALIFLGGIVLVSAISFATSRSQSGPSTEELQKNQAQQQQYYDQCAQDASPGTLGRQCGPDPSTRPLSEFSYGGDHRYRAQKNLPVVVLATVLAAAGLAFIVGASSGGAEWSSRSMTLQLLWEPRRLRLLAAKWIALATVTASLALIAVLLALGLGAITASLRGTWSGRPPAGIPGDLGSIVAQMTLRGLVFVAVSATIGYAIAILVRNTGAALGAAFVYFAVAETALRLALMKYGPEPYLLSTNSVAFLFPGGLDVPGGQSGLADASGYQISSVHLSNLRALLTMLGYAALLILPATWSFSRRDVG